jgi:TonB-dependent receptor
MRESLHTTGVLSVASVRTGVSAIALVAASLTAAPAFAQAAQADEAQSEDAASADDIVVTGYRQALESAQNRRRTGESIVDSVTAEDIGALPDRSVTETLQRIPGITINRFAAGVDPDHFSAEGSGVVVRGLTYVRSEFNGREAYTANNGRGLSFADVPSELLGGVDVFKSPTADRIEGGIAGIVNLRTRLPFDRRGLVVAGSVEVNYSDFIERASPTGAILISNSWDTGIGRLGILGSLSYSQLFTRADRFQVSSFRVRPIYSDGTRTDVVPFGTATQRGSGLFPRGGVLGTQEFDRERIGASAALQWESTDGNMDATFQFLRSDARQAWSEYTVEIATDNVASNGDSRAVNGTNIVFDETGLFASGVITGPTGWRADQTTGDVRTPVLGLQSNNIRRGQESRNVTSDYAFNFNWRVADNFSLSFDYQHVDSFVRVLDNTVWVSTYQDALIELNGSAFPTVQFLPPQNCVNRTAAGCPGTPGSNGGSVGFNDDDFPSYYTGTHQSFSDPFNSFYRSAMDHIEDSEGNSDAFRIDGEFSFPEGGFLRSIRAGIRYADRDQTARFSTYNWGVLSEQWGNGGPVWLSDPVDGVQGGTGGTAPNVTQTFCFDNFFRGSVPNPLNGQCRLFYGADPARYYASTIDYANQIAREWQGTTTLPDGRVINTGWRSLADRPGVVPGTPFLPGEINEQEETNRAAYIMLRFGQEFDSGVILSGNAGVRYTRTRRTSPGFLQVVNNPGAIPTEAVCASVPAGQQPPPFCTFTAAQRQAARDFLNGALTPNDAVLTYEYWLPSVNLRLEVGNGVQFRAAYFRGVAPPEFGFTRNYYNVPGLNAVENRDANGNIIPGSFTIQTVFNAGNPLLEPTTSDNFDLTAEWFFGRVGQLTASFFYKRLNGVLTNDIIRTDITNNGATFPAIVTTPVNSRETGEIRGFEIAYQQVFNFLPGFLRGLGLQANYTFVDSSGVPQSTLSATDPDVAAGRQPSISGDNFPLQGLSRHTVNITPFIDIGPVSARVSYNWRSRYLLTLRDVITPFDPIFQAPYGQVDASILWSISDQIRIGIQGVNLTNSVTRTSAAVLDQNNEVRLVPRGWYQNDRRYSAVLRWSF